MECCYICGKMNLRQLNSTLRISLSKPRLYPDGDQLADKVSAKKIYQWCKVYYAFSKRGIYALCIYKFQLQVLVISLILMFHMTFSSALRPGSSVFGQKNALYVRCSRDTECNTGNGEICYYAYQGCSSGQCMCDPLSKRADPHGICRTARHGGEACNASDVCPEGMTCRDGLCICYQGLITTDGYHCLSPSEKLLGQKCNPSTDVCLQKATYGYTLNEVTCSGDERCICVEGYKQDVYSCKKWAIGEYGCRDNFHCEGGAVCISQQCRCPSGRQPTADNTKCSKIGAITELPIGSACNEIDESRYCSRGLVCHQCGGDHTANCVMSRLNNIAFIPSHSPRTTVVVGHHIIALSLCTAFLLTCVRINR